MERLLDPLEIHIAELLRSRIDAPRRCRDSGGVPATIDRDPTRPAPGAPMVPADSNLVDVVMVVLE